MSFATCDPNSFLLQGLNHLIQKVHLAQSSADKAHVHTCSHYRFVAFRCIVPSFHQTLLDATDAPEPTANGTGSGPSGPSPKDSHFSFSVCLRLISHG